MVIPGRLTFLEISVRENGLLPGIWDVRFQSPPLLARRADNANGTRFSVI